MRLGIVEFLKCQSKSVTSFINPTFLALFISSALVPTKRSTIDNTIRGEAGPAHRRIARQMAVFSQVSHLKVFISSFRPPQRSTPRGFLQALSTIFLSCLLFCLPALALSGEHTLVQYESRVK